MNTRAKALAAALSLLLFLTVPMPPSTAASQSDGVLSVENLTGATATAKAEKFIGEALPLAAAKDAFMSQLHFVQNHGQLDGAIKFYGKSQEHAIYFTESEIYLLIHRKRGGGARPAFVKLTPLNRQGPFSIKPGNPQQGAFNYFNGKYASKWRKNITLYDSVTCQDVYPGINIVFYAGKGHLEYDIVIKNGVDFSQIAFECGGVKRLETTDAGDLVMHLAGGGVIRQHKPVVYQEIGGKRQAVEGSFDLDSENFPCAYTFNISSYSKAHALVIDPVIDYSTFLGGRSWDMAHDITVDSSGYIYLTGWTESIDFPVQNAVQEAQKGDDFVYITDVFITKMTPRGDRLVYSTFLGGSVYRQGNAADFGTKIVADQLGCAYVTGYTNSVDFPTQNPLQKSIAGKNDAFIVKVSPRGDELVYSTYLGGSDDDQGKSIALDVEGNLIATGYTLSKDFPTQHPFQAELRSSADVFMAKISPDGAKLLFSTFLGGQAADYPHGLSVDKKGYAYVAGETKSTDFPTQKAFQKHHAGDRDGFVTKVDTVRHRIEFSTYLGGGKDDVIKAITVDGKGRSHVTGETISKDFPTKSPLQENKSENYDAFISRFRSNGKALDFSTFLGGRNTDNSFGIAVDDHGNIYVAGDTRSTDFPTLNAIQERNAGGLDIFVTKIDSNLRQLAYSTYLGGEKADYGRAVAIDVSGSAYVTGWTKSMAFPLKNGFQMQKSDSCDIFVTRIRE